MEDDTCQSHKFFYALHESHARHNVVTLQVNEQIHRDLEVIVARCEEYPQNYLLHLPILIMLNIILACNIIFEQNERLCASRKRYFA